jgi:hypothetical protein
MKQTHYEDNCNEVEWKVGKAQTFLPTNLFCYLIYGVALERL